MLTANRRESAREAKSEKSAKIAGKRKKPRGTALGLWYKPVGSGVRRKIVQLPERDTPRCAL
jgi:hypothetical protein